MHFASDNTSGAAPAVMAALTEANGGNASGYGNDPWSKRAQARLNDIFERDVESLFVTTGTAANALALALYAKPGGMVLCHEDSHIRVDECGAPELLSGGLRLLTFPGYAGKLTPGPLKEALDIYFVRGVHTGRPVVLSLTNLNEYGQTYSIEEVKALSDLAHAYGMSVHMDGARFANAVVATGASPAELTWKAGVDILTLGGTKNGCWCAEAIVVFDPDTAEDLPYLRKRAGHLVSKGRFLGAQMDAYLADDLWLNLAQQSNTAAKRLADGLRSSNQARLLLEPNGNELFVALPKQVDEAVRAAGGIYYPWEGFSFEEASLPSDDECMVRLVTSFDTTDDHVDDFLKAIQAA